MTTPSRIALALLVCVLSLVSCREAPPPEPVVPLVQATSLMYETTVMPDNRVIRHQLLLANGRVRLGDEAERWRLFDTTAGTITFVDDVARTAKTVRLDVAIAERKALVARPLSDRFQPATINEGDGEPVDGRPARRIVVDAGGYHRELVLSRDPILPPVFFAMKAATDPLDEKNAGMMRDVVPVLFRQTGTVLSDRNELVYGDKTMSSSLRLTSTRARTVPARMFEVPAGYARQ